MIPSTAARTLTELQKKTGKDVFKIERAPSGRALCRWCTKEVPAGRRTFCSGACVNEWRIRNSPSYARRLVLRRDKGVCKECGRDTVAMKRAFMLSVALLDRTEYEALREKLLAEGFDRNALSNRCFWHMDHVIEVVNGGGTCGLDNLVTLCIPCHKKKTRKLAHERAEARKAARQQSIDTASP